MRRVRNRIVLVLTVLACAVPFGTLRAEDTKGKWQIGFGLSYYSTVDYIRSNSDIALAATTAAETGTLPGIGSVDDRPDENMLNQASISDNFKLDFSASYGLTRWLAMELQAGYMKSEVGNIEFYFSKAVAAYGSDSPDLAAGHSVCGPGGTSLCYNYNMNTSGTTPNNTFLPVGEITEIPVMLSGLFRFRPESPLDPYIGLGFGYIYTTLETSGEFNARAEEVANLSVTVASEGEWTDSRRRDKVGAPVFSPAPLQAEVKSGFEYHIVGGVDYYLNDHMSVYVDARYVWSSTEVNITIDNEHQVRMADFLPGKLQTLSQGSVSQPNTWEDIGMANCPTCADDDLYATEDGNGNGVLDTGGCVPGGSGPCEGGTLYFFDTGPDPTGINGVWHDPNDARKTEQCAGCALNNNIDPNPSVPGVECGPANSGCDTEDRNANGFMDRYRIYGVDVCSLPNASTNPLCRPGDFRPTVQYVWPEGCATSVPQGSRLPEGCPPAPTSFAPNSASIDNVQNIYLIQGGEIHLGAFSLGVGFKFTF